MDQTRINRMIRVPEIRVIGPEGEALGIMSTPDALERAVDMGLDLVEISPNAEPPVCRIMDYGKFKYEKSKKEKDQKKKQHVMHLKEIKMHPKTDVHDFDFKIAHARDFLVKGDRVKITVVFRGREIAYKEFGEQLLERVDAKLVDIALCELKNRLEGRNMMSTYVPDKVKIEKIKRTAEKEKKLAEAAAKAAGAPAPVHVEAPKLGEYVEDVMEEHEESVEQ